MSEDDRSQRPASVASQDRVPYSKEETSVPTSDNEDPEKGKDQHNATLNPNDWNGPDDPENPLNWPVLIRYLHVVPPSIISFTA